MWGYEPFLRILVKILRKMFGINAKVINFDSTKRQEKMKTFKEYRLQSNPDEKILHDKFKEYFGGEHDLSLSAVVFGWINSAQTIPNDSLTKREEDICISLIQWLGSHVGQSFLKECGFEKVKH